MGVHEGQGQLARATKDLLRHWAGVKTVWTDANAKRFEENVVQQLELEVRGASAAMAHMSMVLASARRDCQ